MLARFCTDNTSSEGRRPTGIVLVVVDKTGIRDSGPVLTAGRVGLMDQDWFVLDLVLDQGVPSARATRGVSGPRDHRVTAPLSCVAVLVVTEPRGSGIPTRACQTPAMIGSVSGLK